MKLLDRLVRLKVYVQRSMLYYQLLNSALILMIFIGGYTLSPIEKIGIVFGTFCGVVVVGYLDTRWKVLEKEQEHFNKENLAVKEIKDRLKNIEEKLNKI